MAPRFRTGSVIGFCARVRRLPTVAGHDDDGRLRNAEHVRRSDEILDGEPRRDDQHDDHGGGDDAGGRSDDGGLFVGLDDHLFRGRVEPALAERRHRRPGTSGCGGGGGGGDGGLRAVLLGGRGGDRGRGHQRRGRGGRHEFATAGSGLPAVVTVPDGRVRAEGRGSAVTVAETPVRVVRGQYAAERVSELGVEYRVDDRVERRVGVAEPSQHLWVEKRNDVCENRTPPNRNPPLTGRSRDRFTSHSLFSLAATKTANFGNPVLKKLPFSRENSFQARSSYERIDLSVYSPQTAGGRSRNYTEHGHAQPRLEL